MVVSCREDEESATEFLPLSQIPASLASRRRRRRRWDVKSGSTTADVTNDRSRERARLLFLANRYSVLSIADTKLYFDLRYGLRVTCRHVGFYIR